MSSCSDITVVAGCWKTAAGVTTPVSIHYEYRTAANGNRTLHATRYTDASGTPLTIPGADTVAVGACATASPDVEFVKLCDKSAAGVVTEFIRRTVTSFDASNAPTTVVANLALDFVTAYVPAGTVGACQQDCDVVAPIGVVASWG